jgi:rubrerythrin
MSAGKGDSPRPVDGDRYRANYERIFAQSVYPAWICRPCGEAHGRGMPEGHVATWHEDICGVCGKLTSVTEPRDYRHLKKWPILPENH